jgi:hypothetical protein
MLRRSSRRVDVGRSWAVVRQQFAAALNSVRSLLLISPLYSSV